jgi:hypothetical protein
LLFVFFWMLAHAVVRERHDRKVAAAVPPNEE